MSDDELYNAPIIYDAATKTVKVDKARIASWSVDDQAGYIREVEFLNNLSTALLGAKAYQVPPPSDNVNKETSQQIEKILVQAARDLKGGNSSSSKKDAIVASLDNALELALHRAPWESAMLRVQQVTAILAQRCEVNLSRSFWADAAADAEILVMFNSQDWRNHYRRARCLKTIEKYAEAKQGFLVARELAMQDEGTRAMLQKAVDEVDKLM